MMKGAIDAWRLSFIAFVVVVAVAALQIAAEQPAILQTSTPNIAKTEEANAVPAAVLLPEERKIQGQINLNGKQYQAVCDCSQSDRAGNASKCFPPARIRVHQEQFNHDLGLSRESLHAILGSPDNMTMLDLDKVMFSCVDGRENYMVVGTPGGEFGEFLSALSEFERVVNKVYTEEEIVQLLESWLGWEGRGSQPMYYHTDEGALSHLQKYLHINGQIANVIGLEVENPLDQYKEAILNDLPAPNNQGCFHLKAMLQEPSRFYLRPQITPALIRAFHRILWDRKKTARDGTLLYKKLYLEVLQGRAQEVAWMNFKGTSNCAHEHRAPAFTPYNTAGSVFVNHPDAVEVLRKRLAVFFTLHNHNVSFKQLLERFNRQGRRVLEVTAEIMGNQVPFYTVTVE